MLLKCDLGKLIFEGGKNLTFLANRESNGIFRILTIVDGLEH